jgi:hypothetical protein
MLLGGGGTESAAQSEPRRSAIQRLCLKTVAPLAKQRAIRQCGELVGNNRLVSDAASKAKLEDMGRRTHVVWECESKDAEALAAEFLKPTPLMDIAI